MIPQSVITYKLKYSTDDEGKELIHNCMHQYSSILRYAYNRCEEDMREFDIKHELKCLNHIDLMDSHMVACAAKEAGFIKEANAAGKKLIFGGRKNFIDRCKGKISHEEYLEHRLSPLFSIGEANQKANRKVKINQDLHTITFQPNRYNHAELLLKGISGKREKVFSKLYELQEKKELPITYKIDKDYVYISFDESKVSSYNRKGNVVSDRVMSIDLNPNYIGWSVTDWKSSSEFNVIESGVFSIKELNDRHFSLKNQGVSSDDSRRVYLNNKRTFEVYQISKKLIDIALHYKCEIFAMEDLSIIHKDSGKGKNYNSLINNLWNRNKLELNLQKRCNIFQIKFQKVNPEYSSFIGNFLYRSMDLPDMCLASIEIGRRAYEFDNQYIKKTTEHKRNIVSPFLSDFKRLYSKSLEEFGLQDGYTDLVELYYELKNAGTRYRVSLDETKTEFSRCFSKRSLILKSFNGI